MLPTLRTNARPFLTQWSKAVPRAIPIRRKLSGQVINPNVPPHRFLSGAPVLANNARAPSNIAQRLPDPEHPERTQRFRDFDLEGKVFVVTGGGRGLGLTLAEVLVEAGGKGMLVSAPG